MEGMEGTPQILTDFEAAVSEANQVAGPCENVASAVFKFFKEIGANPVTVKLKVVAEEGMRKVMAFDLPNGKAVQVSKEGFHVMVRVGMRVYDAFTGRAGMAYEEYMQRMVVPPETALKVVEGAP